MKKATYPFDFGNLKARNKFKIKSTKKGLTIQEMIYDAVATAHPEIFNQNKNKDENHYNQAAD